MHLQDTKDENTFKDELPGNDDFQQEEAMEAFVDATNFWQQKYEIAKQYDPKSPMMKLNYTGYPSVVLFSHDLVKQWFEYEIKGQIERRFPPYMHKLFGRASYDSFGRVHSDWRKKATRSFKPELIDQYTPFIQQSAQNIVLKNIENVSQNTGEYTYLCDLAKRYTFESSIKFIYGPLLNDEEIENCFKVKTLSFTTYICSICCLFAYLYAHICIYIYIYMTRYFKYILVD